MFVLLRRLPPDSATVTKVAQEPAEPQLASVTQIAEFFGGGE